MRLQYQLTQTADHREAVDEARLDVEEAILTRRSVRAFLPDKPVAIDTVRRILEVSARAPSGTNMQPWKVWVVTGEARARLVTDVLARRESEKDEHKSEWNYYPESYPEPYKSRRRATGWGLYGLLGIEKGDTERMRAQHGRNFTFFDAPVGLIFTIDKVMEIGSWLDYGMFLQNIMVECRKFGLHSCPQVAWPPYHKIIREHLDIPEDQYVVCGMAIGFEDESAPENALRTERESLDVWVTFRDS
ncbi:MAG: nitroreductase [Alphaproteobacteria bacterium]